MKKTVIYIELTLLLAVFASFFSLFALIGISDSIDTDAADKKSYPVIILDAGHGGQDGGASSESGISEKGCTISRP